MPFAVQRYSYSSRMCVLERLLLKLVQDPAQIFVKDPVQTCPGMPFAAQNQLPGCVFWKKRILLNFVQDPAQTDPIGPKKSCSSPTQTPVCAFWKGSCSNLSRHACCGTKWKLQDVCFGKDPVQTCSGSCSNGSKRALLQSKTNQSVCFWKGSSSKLPHACLLHCNSKVKTPGCVFLKRILLKFLKPTQACLLQYRDNTPGYVFWKRSCSN